MTLVLSFAFPISPSTAQPHPPNLISRDSRRAYFWRHRDEMGHVSVRDAERIVAAMVRLQRNAESNLSQQPSPRPPQSGTEVDEPQFYPHTIEFLDRRTTEAFKRWLNSIPLEGNFASLPLLPNPEPPPPLPRIAVLLNLIGTFLMVGIPVTFDHGFGHSKLIAGAIYSLIVSGVVYPRFSRYISRRLETERARRAAFELHAAIDAENPRYANLVNLHQVLTSNFGIWLNAEMQSHGVVTPTPSMIDQLQATEFEHATWRMILSWLGGAFPPPTMLSATPGSQGVRLANRLRHARPANDDLQRDQFVGVPATNDVILMPAELDSIRQIGCTIAKTERATRGDSTD